MKYVIGLGKTGTSLAYYLLNNDIPFIAWDDTPTLQEKARLMGCSVVAPRQAPWHIIEELILSPGIPTTFPSPHFAVELAKRYKVPFRGDIDLWYQTMQHLGCKYVGITGTNGKSTTHAIIDYILTRSGIAHFSGGNSGVPVFDASNISSGSIVNLEMSSYQLDILNKMEFDAGVILNITADHLDRYGCIENYILSKQIQIERVKSDGLKVMGVDTEYSQKAYDNLVKNGHDDIISISALKTLEKGVYAKNRKIYSTESGCEVELGEMPDSLPGDHNAQNVMAAMLVCRFLNIVEAKFFEFLTAYPGLAHRQEKVLDIPTALFINDSKATNADAALPALKTFDHIYWIVGGIAKEEGVVPLLPHLQNVEKIFLIGSSVKRFQEELKTVSSMVKVANTLDEAVNMIQQDLRDIDYKVTVLLSPACASQDQFQNFEHRGAVFKEMVLQRFGAE